MFKLLLDVDCIMTGAMSTKRNLAEEAETMERRLIAADKLIGGLGTITLEDCMP